MKASSDSVSAPIFKPVKDGDDEKMNWMFTVLAAGHASQGAIHVVSWVLSISWILIFTMSTAETHFPDDKTKMLGNLTWIYQLSLVVVILLHSSFATNRGRFADTWHQLFMFFLLWQFACAAWLFQWGYVNVPDGDMHAMLIIVFTSNATGIALSNFVKYMTMNKSLPKMVTAEAVKSGA